MELASTWMRACRFTCVHLSQVLVLSHFIFSLILPLLCSRFLQFLSTSFPPNSLLIRGNSPEVVDNPSSEQRILSCSRKTRWRERWQRSLCSSDTCSLQSSQPPCASCSVCVVTEVYVSLSLQISPLLSVNVADSAYSTDNRGAGSFSRWKS